MTRLFDLSRDILLTTDSERAIADVARYVARRFELEALRSAFPRPTAGTIHQGGERRSTVARSARPRACAAARSTRVRRAPARLRWARRGWRTPRAAIDAGAAAAGHEASRHARDPVRRRSTSGTLDALGGVVAIAIERAHFLAERKKAETLESARRSGLGAARVVQPRSANAPDGRSRRGRRTCRTSRLPPDERHGRRSWRSQELDRLTRLFQDILDMARIDAAAVIPSGNGSPRRTSSRRPSLTSDQRWQEHALEIDADDAVEIQVDPRLTSTALAHVLENAARYSPAGRPIAVRAWTDAEGGHFRCGITVRGSMPPSWTICSSRSIAGSDAARDGDRHGACDHPRTAGGRRRTGLGRERTWRRARSSRSWSIAVRGYRTRRRPSHAVAGPDRGRRADILATMAPLLRVARL